MESAHQSTGYLVAPPSGKGPEVLVLHAWWRLNETINEVCDRLTGLKFVAYAPVLYHGHVATTIEDAKRLGSQLDRDAERAKVETRAAVLRLWAYVEDHSKPC